MFQNFLSGEHSEPLPQLALPRIQADGGKPYQRLRAGGSGKHS